MLGRPTSPEGLQALLRHVADDEHLRGWGVVPVFTEDEVPYWWATILVHVRADSRFDGDGVGGPRAMDLPQFRQHKRLHDASFVQFLVNKRTDPPARDTVRVRWSSG